MTEDLSSAFLRRICLSSLAGVFSVAGWFIVFEVDGFVLIKAKLFPTQLKAIPFLNYATAFG